MNRLVSDERLVNLEVLLTCSLYPGRLKKTAHGKEKDISKDRLLRRTIDLSYPIYKSLAKAESLIPLRSPNRIYLTFDI